MTQAEEPCAVFVVGNGEVTALAGGPIPISGMGARRTKRVSRVEFNSATNEWEVLDPVNRALPPLYTDPDYDTCLAWEANHFNQLLATNPDHPALAL